MFRIVRVLPLVALLLMTVGCAHNYYNVPRETYEKKVRILGVAPIFLDGDSDIRFPDREPLLALVRSQNRKNEQELTALLRDTGVYLSVRMLEAQADELFTSLFFRRELRMDAGVTYNKYFFKQQELKDLIGKNQLDALMIVVVSGLTRSEKIYSSNYIPSYLETDYNSLVMSAQILDANGTILWEYPNFQQQSRSFPSLINLQYPDFDEAAANLTDKVDVKFKTLPGITRAFEKTTSSSVRNDVAVSRPYSDVFDDMVSLLRRKPRFFWEKEETPPSKPEPAMTPASQPEPKGAAVTPPPQPAKPETIKVEPAAESVPPPPGEIKTEDLK